MPKVTFVKEKTEIEVPEGANLRQAVRDAGIQVYQGLEELAERPPEYPVVREAQAALKRLARQPNH